MKANAPEKIYIFEEDLQHKDHIVMYGINQDKDIRELIEYTRTDAFIEKAVKWLEEHKEAIAVLGFIPYYYIEDFKKYIEE